MSDSVNPAGPRPSGGRGYGAAGGRPADAAPATGMGHPSTAAFGQPAPLAQPEPLAQSQAQSAQQQQAPSLSQAQSQAPSPSRSQSRAQSQSQSRAQAQDAQVSGFGRTLNRMGSAMAAGVQTASGAARGATAARPVGSQVRVRKARLRVARVDPWSVMKVAFVLSIALGIVTLVGTAVVWEVLNGLGVFSSLNKTVGDLTSSGSGASTYSLSSVLSFTRVEGYMLIVALVDIVLVTALATLGAYLYNLSSGFVGGLEVTLAEDQ